MCGIILIKPNALSTVRCAEFSIPSCHCGSNYSIHSGRNLVPIISDYMPRLQTLRLSRPDDFPWTSGKFILSEDSINISFDSFL